MAKNIPSPQSNFHFKEITEEDFLRHLRNVGNPTLGTDGIFAYGIKGVATRIQQIVCHIINLIFKTSKYPTDLERARVVPIPKTRSPTSPSDFRPISVLPELNKVIERTLIHQLTAHFESNNFLHEYQLGYRQIRSTHQAVVKTTGEIRWDLDRGAVCGAVA